MTRAAPPVASRPARHERQGVNDVHPHRTEPGPGRLLSRLALIQHGLFAALLLVCSVLALVDGTAPLVLLAVLALTLAWYAAGVRLARSARGSGGAWWLLGLSGCWLLLVAVSPDFVWLGFVLWLLAGHFLGLPASIGFVVVTLLVVIGAPVAHGEPWRVAGVVGPTVGAVFALVLSRGEHRLVRDSLERAELVTSLMRAQAEADALHAELAEAQREAGAVAERTRLSRDIHDTLAQGFSAIVLLTRTARLGDSDAVRAALDDIERAAVSNLEEARVVVAALAPRELAEGSLIAAFRRQLDDLYASTGIEVELRIDGDLASLPTPAEVALLRTLQGALANVRTHAHASRVVVTLARTDDSDDCVLLDVVDDGVGFDVAAWTAARPTEVTRGGYGLRAIRSRLRELGGEAEISSAPGEGTALSARLMIRGAL